MVILLTIIFCYACFKFDRREQALRVFFALIAVTILILVLEILSVVLNASHNINYINAHKAVDTFGFILAPLVPVLAALYVYKRTNEYIKISANKFFWLSIPLAVSGILSLGSYHFNWIFQITSENVYQRGPLFFVSPLTLFFYYLVNLLFLYEKRKQLNKEELFILGLLSLITVVMSIFQLRYFVYLTIWNSMAISIVVNYIFILHSRTKIDPLTGLGNRLAYDEYLDNLSRKSHPVLSVVNIDLDEFKKINDVHGHHEGDKVLRAFAQILKDAFAGQGVPIRLGGDEFIVLIRENQKEKVEKYIRVLQTRVNNFNEQNVLPYRVSFSFGTTILDDTYKDLQQLIQHSDQRMYADKQKKETEKRQKASSN